LALLTTPNLSRPNAPERERRTCGSNPARESTSFSPRLKAHHRAGSLKEAFENDAATTKKRTKNYAAVGNNFVVHITSLLAF